MDRLKKDTKELFTRTQWTIWEDRLLTFYTLKRENNQVILPNYFVDVFSFIYVDSKIESISLYDAKTSDEEQIIPSLPNGWINKLNEKKEKYEIEILDINKVKLLEFHTLLKTGSSNSEEFDVEKLLDKKIKAKVKTYSNDKEIDEFIEDYFKDLQDIGIETILNYIKNSYIILLEVLNNSIHKNYEILKFNAADIVKTKANPKLNEFFKEAKEINSNYRNFLISDLAVYASSRMDKEIFNSSLSISPYNEIKERKENLEKYIRWNNEN